jgi:hypothetical protein
MFYFQLEEVDVMVVVVVEDSDRVIMVILVVSIIQIF